MVKNGGNESGSGDIKKRRSLSTLVVKEAHFSQFYFISFLLHFVFFSLLFRVLFETVVSFIKSPASCSQSIFLRFRLLHHRKPDRK